MNPTKCRLIDLRKISDNRGSLTPIECGRDIPFEIKRIYYLYDVPASLQRGAHAHRALHQFFIPIGGSFDMNVDDGKTKHTYHLDRVDCGLYMPPMIWHDLSNFSTAAVCLALTSDYYNESDYLRTYPEFGAALEGALKS